MISEQDFRKCVVSSIKEFYNLLKSRLKNKLAKIHTFHQSVNFLRYP